jgi:hypothetical protein
MDAMPVGKCRAGQKFNKCNAGGHAWGNLNYRNGWCKAGRGIGQAIKCSGGKGKAQSCNKPQPATAAKNCKDGDVRVAVGTSIGANKDMYPEVAYKGKWYPICGHYFWDNNHGATTFCKQLGFNSGVRRHTRVNFNVDAMPVGKCRVGQRFNKCNAGGHAWGNLNYRNGWCNAGAQWGGRGIGVAIRCIGGKGRTSSCGAGSCKPSKATAKCPSYCSNFKKSVVGRYASPVITQTGFGSNGATFQLSVNLKGNARNLYSVHGSTFGPLTLPPAYQSSKSPLIAGPSSIFNQPDDSFVTVGLTVNDKKQISATPGMGMNKWTSKAGFSSPNAAFFWMNPKAGPKAGKKILVAQVTVAVPCTKLWSVEMGLTGFQKNGKVWRDDKIVFAWSKFKSSGKKCPADVEYKRGPGKVNVEDLLVVLAAFDKRCPQQVSCEVDVETKRSKGKITVEDLLAVLAAFGQKCGN